MIGNIPPYFDLHSFELLTYVSRVNVGCFEPLAQPLYMYARCVCCYVFVVMFLLLCVCIYSCACTILETVSMTSSELYFHVCYVVVNQAVAAVLFSFFIPNTKKNGRSSFYKTVSSQK